MTIEESVEIASVLGNRARFTILQLLLQSPPPGLIVGEIQKTVSLPGSTLSHHLERLRAAGLVTIRRQGTFLWYLPVPDRVVEFGSSLLDLSSGQAEMDTAGAVTRPEATHEVEIEAD